ncbi:hypothetical protein G7Z17_g757 [Cylindrodendrum hubeiense]|uniref:Integral membrane protein n=1 Tax=Cylindrodendrum hubeiense TaxID=595255 RepID=A0A9P5LM11_9HYPO|nr:hypothetical protein G7Z17_g757 [Cylindrodendrum hubeiense]
MDAPGELGSPANPSRRSAPVTPRRMGLVWGSFGQGPANQAGSQGDTGNGAANRARSHYASTFPLQVLLPSFAALAIPSPPRLHCRQGLMDPHRQPQPTGHLQVASSSSSATPHNRRRLSPSPSRSPANPATPAALDDGAGDYFPALVEAPSARSVRSRLSQPSSRRSSIVATPGTRPALDQGRISSIRIRRSSNASIRTPGNGQPTPSEGLFDSRDAPGGRPRSISQPERAHVPDNAGLARHSRRVPQIAMPRLTEEGGRPTLAELGVDTTSPISPTMSLPEHTTSPIPELAPDRNRLQRKRKLSNMFWPGKTGRQTESRDSRQSQATQEEDEYGQELVDWLDMIDPEVQTLSTLTNVQNSLFIPDLGSLINRRPTYVLSQHAPEQEWAKGAMAEERRRADQQLADLDPERPPIQRTSTISSRLTESHYAALPHGTSLEGWSAAEKSELDDHVRHMLHSRRARFKRRMRGFGQYVKRPLGFFVTLYATLITLFGLAWVLFLIGWIYVGDKQVYTIHIIDSVLVALFAVMGDGLAPFRVVDTYHMFFIARYSRMIRNAEKGKRPRSKLRKRSIPDEVQENLDPNGGCITSHEAREILRSAGPCANDENRDSNQMADLESAKSSDTDHDLPALTYAQLKSLQHHQKKFSRSHSFYKPHETFTHHSFPLGYLIAIVVLLDCHSLLQISLGACTWGIDYHTRPFAITTVILCVSITCNITAGLLISRGDRKTRKKEVMELIDRQELTEHAIKHIEEKRKKEQEKAEKEKEQEKEQEKEDQNSQSESSRSGKLFKLPS